MNSFCPYCGTPLAKDAAFCRSCGKPTAPTTPPETPTQIATRAPTRRKSSAMPPLVTGIVLVTILIVAAATCSKQQSTSTDTNTGSNGPTQDSASTIQSERHEIQAVLDQLNSSVDKGYVFENMDISGDDTLTVKMDTDKISTGQDQDRELQVLGEVWVGTYRKYHGGQQNGNLHIEIDDLAGNEVRSDTYYPK